MKSQHTAAALRPRSKFRAWDTSWIVLENNTRLQTLLICEIGVPTNKKKVRYNCDTVITCYWVPFNSI